jgi:hypothetical protein
VRQYLHTDDNVRGLARLLLKLWGRDEAVARAGMMAHRSYSTDTGMRLVAEIAREAALSEVTA